MHLASVAARAGLVAAGTILLAGCTPRQTAMPALVIPGIGDWPTVQVALCGDERISFSDLSKGDGEIEHREPASVTYADRVVVFDLSPASIEAGSLSDEIPVTQFVPYSTVPSSPSGLGRFVVYSTGHRVAIEFSSMWQDPPQPVLVYGVEGADNEAYVKAVSLEEGQSFIDGWCASID